jgi:tetratricopeptide (TPR) repeat protein
MLVRINREREAIVQLDSVHVLASRRWPRASPVIASILHAIAFAHQAAGDNATARPLYEEAAAVYRALPEADPDNLDMTLMNLGAIAELEEDFVEAESRYREVYERRKLRLGADHPVTARSMRALAQALARTDKLDEAEALADQALAIYQRSYGQVHPDLAEGLTARAAILRRQGRAAEAESIQRQAIEMLREVYGPTHSSVPLAISNLAGIVQEQRRLDEAFDLYREALDLYLASRGATHYRTAIVMNNLGWVESLRGRFEESAGWYQRALPVLDSAWNGGWRLASNLVDFATVLIQLRRNEEAEAHARRGYDLARASLPADHVEVIRPQRVLGACLINLRRFEEAETLLLDAHRKLVTGWGANSPFTRSSAQTLARMYELWGRPDQAAPFRATGNRG